MLPTARTRSPCRHIRRTAPPSPLKPDASNRSSGPFRLYPLQPPAQQQRRAVSQSQSLPAARIQPLPPAAPEPAGSSQRPPPETGTPPLLRSNRSSGHSAPRFFGEDSLPP